MAQGPKQRAGAVKAQLDFLRGVDQVKGFGGAKRDFEPASGEVKGEAHAVALIGDALAAVVVIQLAAVVLLDVLEPVDQIVKRVAESVEFNDQTVKLCAKDCVNRGAVLVPALAEFQAAADDVTGGVVGVLAGLDCVAEGSGVEVACADILGLLDVFALGVQSLAGGDVKLL